MQYGCRVSNDSGSEINCRQEPRSIRRNFDFALLSRGYYTPDTPILDPASCNSSISPPPSAPPNARFAHQGRQAPCFLNVDPPDSVTQFVVPLPCCSRKIFRPLAHIKQHRPCGSEPSVW